MEIKKLTSLIIETSNTCNLSCTICPTNNDMKREKGNMSFELFQKTIDGGKSLEHLCLHNWGEPLQNQELFKMIRYAHDRGIRYTVFNTNGTLLNEEMVRQVLDSPLNILRISVDGNPDTYKQVRGIDFEIVEKNILDLVKMRNERNSSLEIGIVMVIDKQTEKDTDSFYKKWSNIVDHVRLQPKLVRSQRSKFCPELFGKEYGKLVVLWDGKVIPCCADYEGKLQIGDVKNETVDSIWDGLTIRRLRKNHLDKDFPEICENCNEYESPKAGKRFVLM